MSSKILKGSQLKNFRRQVARLKSMGLVSKRVDARKQKSTRYMRDQVEKRFKDVLSGKAVAVKLPKRTIAETFEGTFDRKGKRVIVPIEQGAKRPRYNPKTNVISGNVELNGKKFKRIYSKLNADTAHKLKRAKNILYTVHFSHGYAITADTWEQLNELMFGYTAEGGAKKPFKNWEKYVSIDEFEPGDISFEEGPPE